jgi:5-formyltetrahydrofolate cyclo-ligase
LNDTFLLSLISLLVIFSVGLANRCKKKFNKLLINIIIKKMNSIDTEMEMNKIRSDMMLLQTRTGELEANNILLQMKLRIERKQRKEFEDKMKQEKEMLLHNLQNNNMIQNSLLEYQNDPLRKPAFLVKHLTDEINNLKSINEKLKLRYSKDVTIVHDRNKSITKAMRFNVENLR